jgi:cytochrome c oxidase cbb3-type subunit 3
MSDFVSSFWSVYVAGLTALSILFCAFVLWANMTKKQTGPVETHGHVWDETLEEYNNPLPGWWKWLFWITIVFAVVYLAVYPGFGSNKGAFGWSSVGQYEKEMQAANEKYAPIFNKYAAMDLKAVAADGEAKAMGERLFLTYCAQCHGSAAQGAKGFPNLTDSDWLYGGEPETIKTTIQGGRNGVMPPFGQLGAESIKDVANYVRSLSGLAADGLRAERGKAVFEQNCVACHGPEAKGTPALGAPNLTDKVWLYGSSEATIIETVTGGRNNRMPAFQEFLGDAKVHLLSAYVLGLSGGAKQ